MSNTNEDRRTKHFPIFAIVLSAIITVIFGLIATTYSSVEKQIDTKASKESVVLIEQKIEAQLATQNGLLQDLKNYQHEMILLHLDKKAIK